MAELLLGGLIPARWLAPTWKPSGEQLILLNWLYTEIDEHGEEKWPLLKELRGFRNIEVHEFVTGKDSFDWTAHLFTTRDIRVSEQDHIGAHQWAAAHQAKWKAMAWARKHG